MGMMRSLRYICYLLRGFSIFAFVFFNYCAFGSVHSLTDPPKLSVPAQKLRQETVYKLLRAGQVALKNNQLTTPAHANALDLFTSVLTLSPDNAAAKSGMQSILIRYAALIRSSLLQGNIQGATAYLETAQMHFADNPLLVELQNQITQDKIHLNANRPVVGLASTKNVLYLNPKGLRAKSNDVQAQLLELGERLMQSKEGVIIFARSDSEGRWLYKQINRAAKNHRVRGDIKLSKTPRVIIEPPFK